MPRGRKPKELSLTPATPKEKKPRKTKEDEPNVKMPDWGKHQFRIPGQTTIHIAEAITMEEALAKLKPGEYEYLGVMGKEFKEEMQVAATDDEMDADI